MHYGSREALDIENLGKETVRELVDRGMVRDLADLCRLTVDDLLELEGFAQKSARKLYEAIQAARNPRLDRFLYALGIRHVGRRTARLLAQEFGSLDKLRRAGEKRLREVADIGPVMAKSIRKFFDDATNKELLKRLQQAGVRVRGVPGKGESRPLRGKTFVFTGGLENFSREEAKEAVELRGGRATSSVSGNTDFLVSGENPGSKVDEARSAGVKVIDERQFEELLAR